MTLTDISDIAQILAAIAVIPSLIFVGLQMRQNTRAVRAATSQAHASTYLDVMRSIGDSEEVSRIMMVGVYSPEKLSDTDMFRFMILLATQFRFFDASYTQYRDGQLDEAHWRSIEQMILNNNGAPGYRIWWELRKNTLSGAFCAWYDAQDLHASKNLVDTFMHKAGKGMPPA